MQKIIPKSHNIISADLRQLIDAFFSLQDWEGLYLSGGTCLAEYYFGHRNSIDMDLFTQDKDLYLLACRYLQNNALSAVGNIKSIRSTPLLSQFVLQKQDASDPIKIDVMLDIPVVLDKKIKVGKVWIDSLRDLAANKIGCIIQREETKDYLDLFYLIPTLELSAPQIIELGKKKDAGIDPIILAHQLTYIQSIKEKPDYFFINVPWQHVLRFFKDLHDEMLDYYRAR